MKSPNHQYHIQDFCLIIKSLYPHKETVNKYKTLLHKYGEHHLTLRQTEQLEQLIKAITILHQNQREQSHWGIIYTEQEDIYIALSLMEREISQQPEILLSVPERRFYNQLKMTYNEKPFTRKEASILTQKSKTNTWWKLWELETKGLIKKVGGTKNRGYYYQLK